MILRCIKRLLFLHSFQIIPLLNSYIVLLPGSPPQIPDFRQPRSRQMLGEYTEFESGGNSFLTIKISIYTVARSLAVHRFS